MARNFLEKLYTKRDEETSTRLFSKKSKLSICLNHQSEWLYSFFLLYVQDEDYQNILKQKLV